MQPRTPPNSLGVRLACVFAALLCGTVAAWLVVAARDTRHTAEEIKTRLLLTPIGESENHVTMESMVCYETDVPCKPFPIHVKVTAPTVDEAIQKFRKAIAAAEALTEEIGTPSEAAIEPPADER